MYDPPISSLLEQLSKTKLSSEPVEPIGVSFRGKGLKLNTAEDAEEVVEAIRKTPDMTFLDLEGNTLGVDAAKAIGEALKNRGKLTRALWKDLFTGRMKTEIPKALKYLGEGLKAANAHLVELDLSDNAFGPIGVEALADLLKSSVCYKLEELRLNNNGLGITGGKILASALLQAQTNCKQAGGPMPLKVFIAGRNRLENDGAAALALVFKVLDQGEGMTFTPTGEQMKNLFKELGSLEEISMPQNGIYHKGIAMISEALACNTNLRLLNLNDNTLTARGAKSLAIALPSLQKLACLNLGDCLLKTKGAIIIADALASKHNELEEVFFDSNEIRTEGGLALIRALQNKKQLSRISLIGNEFGEEGRDILLKEAENLSLDEIIDCPSDEDIDADEEQSEGDEGESEGGEEDESCDENHSTCPESPSQLETKSAWTDATILQFLMEPTEDNFLKLAEKEVDAIVESMRIPPNCMDVETCVKLIMKISSLGSSKNEDIKSLSRKVAIALYKALFSWAEGANELSSVNNILFVYLQLIKDEDSQRKISWNVDECVNVLEAAMQEKIVPTFTQHILNCCMERKRSQVKKFEEITL